VGDVVNLAQRLQQWAEPGETVLSEATWAALREPLEAVALEPALVKGRDAPVRAYKNPAPALGERTSRTRLGGEDP
jgi:class 3 adenylate cyclase